MGEYNAQCNKDDSEHTYKGEGTTGLLLSFMWVPSIS